MNKEVNFSRFVGIGILLICVVVVILALGSAIIQNENANNIIYVEDFKVTTLSIAKSNVVTEYVDTEKTITSGKYALYVKVRLPKVNIQTEQIEKMNKEIYNEYQELYNYAMSITNNESIEIDYTYEYLNDDRFLEIVIEKGNTVEGKEEITTAKYKYDIVNDSYVVE